MKKLFFSLLFVCFLLINCESKETMAVNADAKKTTYRFYNPKINTINNDERKVVFNVDLLETAEMEFLKNGIIKTLTGFNFNRLAGISVYYDNAVLNSNVKISEDHIIGLIIYELDKSGLMRHRFFQKKVMAHIRKSSRF